MFVNFVSSNDTVNVFLLLSSLGVTVIYLPSPLTSKPSLSNFLSSFVLIVFVLVSILLSTYVLTVPPLTNPVLFSVIVPFPSVLVKLFIPVSVKLSASVFNFLVKSPVALVDNSCLIAVSYTHLTLPTTERV